MSERSKDPVLKVSFTWQSFLYSCSLPTKQLVESKVACRHHNVISCFVFVHVSLYSTALLTPHIQMLLSANKCRLMCCLIIWIHVISTNISRWTSNTISTKCHNKQLLIFLNLEVNMLKYLGKGNLIGCWYSNINDSNINDSMHFSVLYSSRKENDRIRCIFLCFSLQKENDRIKCIFLCFSLQKGNGRIRYIFAFFCVLVCIKKIIESDTFLHILVHMKEMAEAACRIW